MTLRDYLIRERRFRLLGWLSGYIRYPLPPANLPR